ncbi:MAG: DUF4366 domain-containing protein [Eubacterium sp.]|nr:DUF4366 domain-containing protein [Eubacterium sp.]
MSDLIKFEKISELIANRDKKKVRRILIIAGIILAAGVAFYFLYRYFAPDYIDEYDDGFDDDFDDDFFDDED